MRCLIRSVPWNEERYSWALELAGQLPGAEIIDDREYHDGYLTLLDALEAQGTEDVWHFEDDAVLTEDWAKKAAYAELFGRRSIIQGFSRWGNDAELGSRWCAGRTFMHSQCFRVPGEWAPSILAFARTWKRDDPRIVAAQPTDGVFAAWMAPRKIRYWLVVPSLIQHREAKSVMNPKRSSRRQSSTFV